MKEKNYLVYESNSRIYETKIFKKDLTKDERIAYSYDKKYVLIYSDSDVDNAERMYEFMNYENYLPKRSIEDEYLDNYFEEFNIIKDKFNGLSMILQQISDDETEASFNFENMPNNSIPIGCLFNKKESKENGSKVIFGLQKRTKSKDDNKIFITLSIGKKTNTNKKESELNE